MAGPDRVCTPPVFKPGLQGPRRTDRLPLLHVVAFARCFKLVDEVFQIAHKLRKASHRRVGLP